MKREDNDAPTPLTDDRVGCIQDRVGGEVHRSENRRSLVQGRTNMAHKLLGSLGSFPGSQVHRQEYEKSDYLVEDRQHDNGSIRQQSGRDSVPPNEQNCKEFVAMVPSEGHPLASRALAGCIQYDCRRGIQSDEGSVRLDAEHRSISGNPEADGPAVSEPLCLETDNPTTRLLQLETRPRGKSLQCISSGLEEHSGSSLCQPTMVTGGESGQQGHTAKGDSGSGIPSLEDSSMVPNGSEPFGAKSYDSLFNKWVCWCNEQNADPVSGPISDVVNFLADLFKQGYEYKSLNAY